MDFDESQHERDNRGRFVGGGLGGFALKHSGKLEGYSTPKDKPGLDKWAGKVSGRNREIEVPLVSKTTGGDFASTGNMPMNEETMEHVRSFLSKSLDTKTSLRQLDELKSAKKSYTMIQATNKKLQERIKNPRDEKDLAAAKKKLAASDKKLVAARSAIDVAHAANQDSEARARAVNNVRDALKHAFSKEGTDEVVRTRGMSIEESNREGAWNPIKASYNPIKLAGWKDSGATINVQVDRKDGTVDVHLAGESHDSKFPGEKELHLTVKPEKYTSAKNAYWEDPKQEKAQRSDREESLSTQYPSDDRGKQHPNEVNLESKGIGNQTSFYLPNALRDHVQKFLKS